MRKINKKIWIPLVVLFVVLSACSSGDTTANKTNEIVGENENKEKVINLKVADSVPDSNFISTEGISFWMEKVKELTDNQVEFQYYPAEQLGEADSLLKLTQSKSADIGYISYATDEIPLQDIMSLPGAVNSSTQGSEVLWKLAQNTLLDKVYLEVGVRPVFAATLPPYQIVTSDKKVEDTSDFKGLKVRTSGAIDLTVDKLESTPVSMAAPEMYTAMERGTLDGTVLAFTSFKPYQIQEIAKYSTINANLGSFAVVYGINEEVYEGLPDNVKEAMLQAGDETVEHFSAFLESRVDELTSEFEEAGMDMYNLDDNTLKTINEKTEPVWDEWAQKLEKRGQPANDIIDAFKEANENIK